MFQVGWKIEDGENPLFNFPLGFKDKTLACRSDLETVKASHIFLWVGVMRSILCLYKQVERTAPELIGIFC